MKRRPALPQQLDNSSIWRFLRRNNSRDLKFLCKIFTWKQTYIEAQSVKLVTSTNELLLAPWRQMSSSSSFIRFLSTKGRRLHSVHNLITAERSANRQSRGDVTAPSQLLGRGFSVQACVCPAQLHASRLAESSPFLYSASAGSFLPLPSMHPSIPSLPIPCFKTCETTCFIVFNLLVLP